MPGRKLGMARKATRLESAVLKLYRLVDKLTPDIHKKTERRHGVTAPTSSWVAFHRLGCELLLAAAELGQHYRKDTSNPALGPIMEAIGTGKLAQIRRKYQRGLGERTLEEIAQCHAAAEIAYAGLPMSADPPDEVTWAMIHQLDSLPDFETAPSQSAISLWFALAESPALRNRFHCIVWNKRLPRGDWAVKDEQVVEEAPDPRTLEEVERDLRKRLFGDAPEEDRDKPAA